MDKKEIDKLIEMYRVRKESKFDGNEVNEMLTEIKQELVKLFAIPVVSHSTANLLDKLKKEIKEYDSFCFQLFSVRYDDAKPQDAWYDDYLDRYHKAKARIELLTELLE